MSFFTGPYLRILTPETINGVYPKMGRDGRQTFKETHLPVSARPAMERLNRKLPDALKKRIEVVGEEYQGHKSIAPDEAAQLRAKIQELEAQNAQLKAQPVVSDNDLFDGAEQVATTVKTVAKK
jgi:hypothetical protein